MSRVPFEGFIGHLSLETMLKVVQVVKNDKRREIQRNAAIQIVIEAALNEAAKEARFEAGLRRSAKTRELRAQ